MVIMTPVFFKRFFSENLLSLFPAAVILSVFFLFPKQSFCDGHHTRITFKRSIVFDAMKPKNIFPNNQAAQIADEGVFSSDIRWDGTVTEAGLITGNLQKVYRRLTFRRWTNESQSNQEWLWQLIYYDDDDDYWWHTPTFNVSIVDQYGNSGKMSHVSDPGSWIKISVNDKKVNRVSGYYDDDDDDDDIRIYRGTVRLKFDISHARRSGTYRGTIFTTLSYI